MQSNSFAKNAAKSEKKSSIMHANSNLTNMIGSVVLVEEDAFDNFTALPLLLAVNSWGSSSSMPNNNNNNNNNHNNNKHGSFTMPCQQNY